MVLLICVFFTLHLCFLFCYKWADYVIVSSYNLKRILLFSVEVFTLFLIVSIIGSSVVLMNLEVFFSFLFHCESEASIVVLFFNKRECL